jgi:hypothetical protein
MNWTAIHAWLYTGSWLGIHRVAWAGLTAMAIVELFLGRSKNPQLRSVASAIALAIQKTLEVTKISSIPVVGPLVVNVLKTVDGDATPMLGMMGRPRVTGTTKALDQPPPPEPPKAA